MGIAAGQESNNAAAPGSAAQGTIVQPSDGSFSTPEQEVETRARLKREATIEQIKAEEKGLAEKEAQKEAENKAAEQTRLDEEWKASGSSAGVSKSPEIEVDELSKQEARARAKAEAEAKAAGQAKLKTELEKARQDAEAHAKAADARAAEEARQAAAAKAKAEAKAAEDERLATEARAMSEAHAKADAETRAAEQSWLAADTNARIVSDGAAQTKAKAVEQAWLAAETQARADEASQLETEARARAAEQARQAVAAKAKAEAEARAAEQARMEAAAQAKAEAEVRAKTAAVAGVSEQSWLLAAANASTATDAAAETQAHAAGQTWLEAAIQARADEAAQFETEARAHAEAQARLDAEAKAKAEADARTAEEARLAAEVSARQAALASTAEQSQLNAELGTAQQNAEALAKAEAESKAAAQTKLNAQLENARQQAEALAKAEAAQRAAGISQATPDKQATAPGSASTNPNAAVDATQHSSADDNTMSVATPLAPLIVTTAPLAVNAATAPANPVLPATTSAAAIKEAATGVAVTPAASAPNAAPMSGTAAASAAPSAAPPATQEIARTPALAVSSPPAISAVSAANAAPAATPPLPVVVPAAVALTTPENAAVSATPPTPPAPGAQAAATAPLKPSAEKLQSAAAGTDMAGILNEMNKGAAKAPEANPEAPPRMDAETSVRASEQASHEIAMQPGKKAEKPNALLETVQKAILNNPDVLTRWHNFLAAVKETDSARGGYFPHLDLSANTGNEDYGAGAVTPETRLERHGATLTLKQMLYDGFATRDEVRRLNNAELARYYELLDATETAALEALRAYYDVSRYRKLLELTKDNYVTHRTAYEQIDQKVKAGVGRRVDLEQASGRVALSQSNLLLDNAAVHDVAARYQRIIGDLPPADIDESFSRKIQNKLKKLILPQAEEATLSVAIDSHPAILAAIENVRSAKYDLAERSARFLPTVNFQLTDQRNSNFAGVPGPTNDTVAEIVLDWNLFNGATDKTRIDQYANKLEATRDTRDKTCRDVRQTLAIAYNDVWKLQQQLDYLDEHQTAVEKAFVGFRRQFEIGQRSLLDVLDTENELYQAKRSYLNAEYDLYIAHARTLAGMGRLVNTLGLSRLATPDLPELLGSSTDGAENCPPDAPQMETINMDELNERAIEAARPPARSVESTDDAVSGVPATDSQADAETKAQADEDARAEAAAEKFLMNMNEPQAPLKNQDKAGKGAAAPPETAPASGNAAQPHPEKAKQKKKKAKADAPAKKDGQDGQPEPAAQNKAAKQTPGGP